MYNKYLPIFIKVANCGSFSKASRELFISPNAVIKQINHLEEGLGLALFNRSHRGLTLTEEGRLIYEKSQYLIQFSNDAINQAKELRQHRIEDITIGISTLRHFMPYTHIIKELKSSHSDFNMNIVSFSDKYEEYSHLLDHLGEEIDCIFGAYSSTYSRNRVNILHIQNYPLCIAASINHPLALRESLTLEDLNGYKVMIVERGDTKYIDILRDEIEENYPDIEIINAPAYDIDTFNLCDSLNGLMLSIDLWENIHPLLLNIPLKTKYYVPYGLMYSLQPEKKIINFVTYLEKILRKR